MAANLPGDGKSGQGTSLTPDGQELLVADYSRGVGFLDLASFKTTILPRNDGKPLRGIDGMVRCGNVYYGIYNGATPGALLAIRPTDTGVTFEEVVSLPDPTQVAFDGNRLLVVADSGWATIDKPDFKRTVGAPIVSIPLSEDCKPQ